MIQQGICNPSDEDVCRRLSTGELTLQCKRVTRGRAETTRLVASRSYRSRKTNIKTNYIFLDDKEYYLNQWAAKISN